MMLLNHLWCHWHRRRFGGGLPGLVDQVQVAVHPSHLVQRKRVRTGIVCGLKRLLLSVRAEFGIDLSKSSNCGEMFLNVFFMNKNVYCTC